MLIGVPQVTVWAPFYLFCLSKILIMFKLYADDFKLYSSFRSNNPISNEESLIGHPLNNFQIATLNLNSYILVLSLIFLLTKLEDTKSLNFIRYITNAKLNYDAHISVHSRAWIISRSFYYRSVTLLRLTTLKLIYS